MRLKNYNLSKLESTGRRIWFEKLIGEIVDKVSTSPTSSWMIKAASPSAITPEPDPGQKKTDKTPSV